MAQEKTETNWCHVASDWSVRHQEMDKQTAAGYDILPEGKGILTLKEASKMKAEEGLAFLPNEHWGVLDMTDLPWQFGPSGYLDYVSQERALEETSMSEFQEFSRIAKKQIDCGESAEIELEWQWIVDQQQPYKHKSGPCTKLRNCEGVDNAVEVAPDDSSSEACKKGTDETGTQAEKETSVANFVSDGLKLEETCSSGTSSSRRSGNLSMELGSTKLQLKDSTSWRTADSKELAALVSQKTLECVENCDLPPSQKCTTLKGPLAICDFTCDTSKVNMSQPVDKLFLASLFCESEPTQLDNKPLPSSPLIMGMSDPTPLTQHPLRVSKPLAIPSVPARTRSRCLSLDDRSTSLNGSAGCTSVTGRGSDMLGEALCHSQTRAREAERVAAQALKEKEKLVNLLFREAYTSRTYKHLFQILETENMRLKMHRRNESGIWMEDTFLDPCFTLKSFANSRWKHIGKRASRKRMRHHLYTLWQSKGRDRGWIFEGNVVVGCTIGLAFALGLSVVGAGLMIGWSMGWILLAY